MNINKSTNETTKLKCIKIYEFSVRSVQYFLEDINHEHSIAVFHHHWSPTTNNWTKAM